MEFLRVITRNTGNLVALIIVAAVFIAVASTFLVAACGGVAPLPPGESCMQCAREWIGSLSGWFAGAAAVATGLVILIQIKVMKDQLSEQKVQTQYVVGNLPPTVEFKNIDSQKSSAIISIKNVGRRTLQLRDIVVKEPSDVMISNFDSGVCPPIDEQKRSIGFGNRRLDTRPPDQAPDNTEVVCAFRRNNKVISGSVSICVRYYFCDDPDRELSVDKNITFKMTD